MFSTTCGDKLKTCKKVDCIKHAKQTHAIFIDDLSEVEAIQLKKQLVPDPVNRPYPLQYHERTQQILPQESSILQKNLIKIENFTKSNQIKINPEKSNVMVFNKSRKFDFPPEMKFQDGNILECVEETRLLGIQLASSVS